MKTPIVCSGLLRRGAALTLAAAVFTSGAFAQLIYQEGFNDDGSAANPPRYTFTGRDVFEVPRIQSELGNYDQKGPLYWAHNFDTTFVGVPQIPARRMMFTWRPGTDPSAVTEDLLELWDSAVGWLLAGKANATIVVHPNADSLGVLRDRLVAAGHSVVDDDATTYPDEQDVPGDLMVHGPASTNPSRFVLSPKPVIVINNPDWDDMLTGSIGSAATFAAGQVTISAAGHPAAGGKTGTFDAFVGDQTFELVGSFLAPGAITVATATRVVSPSVAGLADVDAIIAGTKQHESSASTVADIDFSDNSSGSWFTDNTIPGGYTGNWGLRVQGKLMVDAAGTYRMALGSDDGARLQIDLDRNGLSASDNILEDPGPHAHAAVYANVVFPASGEYDFEIRSYNNGAGGSLEFSVAVQAGEIPDDNLGSGYWEVVGPSGVSPVKLQGGSANVTAYIATGENVEVQTPLVVLLNGPNDTPAGGFYDGGPFTGYEGAGFIGASGINKWPYPDGLAYRSVRLRPVNVAGQTDVKLTIALAATVVDFEDSDLIDVVVYPQGENSAPVTLAHFRGVQNAIQPWLADQNEGYVRRLTKQFADFTYNVPTNATDLVVEIRAATTWWTEIAAFDNIRITVGAATTPLGAITATPDGAELELSWTGGTPPYLVQGKLELDGDWLDLQTVNSPAAIIPMAAPGGFFRVSDAATKTVKLFRAVLNGAAERPTPNNQPGTGMGLLALDGLTATYVVSYENLSVTPSAFHLHGLGTAEEAVGVKFNLVPAGTLGTSGLFVGQSTVDQATADGIAAGLTYFNIHTPGQFAAGEIRGQVVPVP